MSWSRLCWLPLVAACWRGGATETAGPSESALARPVARLDGFVVVPEGTITDGCLPHRGARCLGREMPEFEILPSYVSKEDWGRCASAGGCRPIPLPGADLPMTGVTFDDARRFCRWAGAHLATESEWERARSAGIIQPGESRGEWLDGWYTYYGPRAELGNGEPNARLIIRIFDGNSYRYGIRGDRRQADLPLGFRCARGATPTDPPPAS